MKDPSSLRSSGHGAGAFAPAPCYKTNSSMERLTMKNLKNKLGLLVLFISGILLNAQLGLSQQQIGSKPCYMPKNGYGTGGCASKPGGYSESIWKKPAQQPNSHTPRPCDQTPIVVEHGSVEIKDEWTQLIHCDSLSLLLRPSGHSQGICSIQL